MKARLAAVLLVSALFSAPAQAATSNGGVILLTDCAPVFAPVIWRQRLRAWGYAVTEAGGHSCSGTLSDTALSAARQARRRLAAQPDVDPMRIALLGWNGTLLYHAAGTVAGGRPNFAAMLLSGDPPAGLIASTPLLERIEQRPAQDVRDFLQRSFAGSALAAAGSRLLAIEPGPDLPPVGRSLFDQLFPDGPPFPFEALLASLDEALGPQASPISTLLPQGRSLQREAGGSRPFHSPRAVVSIDRAPPHAAYPLLRDRLFIGYQPLAELLEVISWNPEAGRFEFQLVRDYAADRLPQVRQARRQLCLACHQNRAPLFSAAPWDESSDNLRVAARLREVDQHFYGIVVRVANNNAVLVDNATDRANRLPLFAELWQGLCGQPGQAQRRCRAALLQAMLQYRLSRSQDFADESAGFREDFLLRAQASWRRTWPRGLTLASPDIDNRDPLRDTAILGAQDPLLPRPSLLHWQWGESPPPLIAEMAADLPEPQLLRLDRILSGRAGEPRWLQAGCHVAGDFQRVGWRLRELDCAGDFTLKGQFRWRPNGAPADAELSLALPGAVPRLRLEADGKGDEFHLRWRDSPLRLRAVPQALGERLRVEGDVVRLALQDVDVALSAALQQMAADELGVLAADQWRPDALLHELLGKLGEPAPGWSMTADVPPARVDELPGLAVPKAAEPLLNHCAVCHAGPDAFPPPFLASTVAETERRLLACGPRIHARLALWHADAAHRPHSPMPPHSVVGEGFAQSEDYTELLALAARYAGDIRGQRYDELPVCRPLPSALAARQ